MLVGRFRGQVVPSRFCGEPDGDGHLLWECTLPPLVEIRANPEFHDLMRMDKGHWPRCLLWHGWLPMLSGVPGASPWAASAAESASYLVEAALGCYSSGMVAQWSPPDEFDGVEAASLILDHPNVWTDGSLVLDQVTGVSSSGGGFFAHQSVHLGVDNLGVVRHVGRLLDGRPGSIPFELVNDGDLLLLIDRMLHLRGLGTVRITKVKGHADEGMVLNGRVREVERLGNDAADEAADFGRRRVGNAVIDARRNLSGVCGRRYPVLLDLHRFFIAISRAVVSHDGREGTAPDPMVWSAGALSKRRRLVHAVRDQAFLPGPPGIGDSEWVNIPASAICAEDIAHWPYTPGLSVEWVSFFGSLHWPAGCLGLGVGGVSDVDLLILYELWAGERLSLEEAVPRYLRPGRPILVSVVPFGPGIDIWRSCRFVGTLVRSLCLLPGELGRFVPCSFGANHCRLRRIGWEKCRHGLTSRPRETASELFLNELLGLFRPESARASLAGTLPFRYCAARFACRTPTWRCQFLVLLVDLDAAYSDAGHRAAVDEVGREVHWVSGSGPGRKRIRLNRKTPAHLVGSMVQSRPRVWKRLRHVGFSSVSIPDHKRRRSDQANGRSNPAQVRTAWCPGQSFA